MKQQEGNDEETGKQLQMDGGLESCHQVDRRAQEARDQSQITLGRRYVAGPARSSFFGHLDSLYPSDARLFRTGPPVASPT